MSKREKMIVGAVMVAAVVAAYIQFFAPSGGEMGLDLQKLKQELTAFVTSTSTVVVQARPTEPATFAIAVAQRPWERDPFLKTDEPIDIVKASEVTFPGFRYTGFVVTGSRRLAVINGVEYEAGQELDPPGFELREIFPEKVLIGVRAKEQETSVMLVEEEQGAEAQRSEVQEANIPEAPDPLLRHRKTLALNPGATDAPIQLKNLKTD